MADVTSNVTLWRWFYLPRVTDCEPVVDPTRLIAPQWYTPASVNAMFFIVSDGEFMVPPEYLALSKMSKFLPLYNQYTAVNAGEPWVTLAVQWMAIVVPVSDIVPCIVTIGLP